MATDKTQFEKPVRIYELARRFEVPNKELIRWLQGRGYAVTTHSNTLPPEEAQKVVAAWEAEHTPQPKAPEPEPPRTPPVEERTKPTLPEPQASRAPAPRRSETSPRRPERPRAVRQRSRSESRPPLPKADDSSPGSEEA
ncbi:MAG: hypothetical protein KatS3mg115_2633 [Candidatus Poribacteria bacterium]|nr:MAG: hypothetical protein KatS3mg115_2633 [Candidatus Poribacteria bacterium]